MDWQCIYIERNKSGAGRGRSILGRSIEIENTMVEKWRKFSQTELDPEAPPSTKRLGFAKLFIHPFVAKSKATFYQLLKCIH